jgi:hypothetical protein
MWTVLVENEALIWGSGLQAVSRFRKASNLQTGEPRNDAKSRSRVAQQFPSTLLGPPALEQPVRHNFVIKMFDCLRYDLSEAQT